MRKINRWVRVSVLGTVLVAATTGVAIAPSHAGPPGGLQIAVGPPAFPDTIKLINNQNGDELCISPAGGSTEANAGIVQYYCDFDPSRLWELLRRDDGYYEIYNEHSGQCLSPAGGATTAGDRLVQYWCDIDPARGWYLADYGYQLRNEHSGLCISIGSVRGANAGITQDTCGGASTLWQLSHADAITSVYAAGNYPSYPASCLEPNPDVVNGTIVNGACAPYRISQDPATGTFYIRDVLNGLCLSPAGGSTAENALIVQYYCDADPSRHWVVIPFTDEPFYYGLRYEFMNVHSGLCLAPYAKWADNALYVYQSDCTGPDFNTYTLQAHPDY